MMVMWVDGRVWGGGQAEGGGQRETTKHMVRSGRVRSPEPSELSFFTVKLLISCSVLDILSLSLASLCNL